MWSVIEDVLIDWFYDTTFSFVEIERLQRSFYCFLLQKLISGYAIKQHLKYVFIISQCDCINAFQVNNNVMLFKVKDL